MSSQPLTKTIPAIIALCAFVMALLSGLAVDNSSVTILSRALVVLAAGYAVGTAVAKVAETAITEYLREYRANAPVPEEEMAELEAAVDRHGIGRRG